jgi:hypothetical protein
VCALIDIALVVSQRLFIKSLKQRAGLFVVTLFQRLIGAQGSLPYESFALYLGAGKVRWSIATDRINRWRCLIVSGFAVYDADSQ